MKKKLVISLLALVVIVSLCFAGPTSAAPKNAKVYKWRIQSMFPPAPFPPTVLILEWVKKVEVASGGRLDIEIFPAGAIVGAFEIFDAVKSGSIDAGWAWPGLWYGKEPALTLLGIIPGSFNTWDVFMWMEQGGGIQLAEELYAKHNLKYLWFGLMGPEAAYSSKVKIVDPKDYKGLKYRGTGWTGEILAEPEFGASTIMLPTGDVYTALERGVVDAVEFANPFLNYSLGFHEVTKYLGMPGAHQPSSTYDLFINMKRWNELPPDLQEILRLSTYEFSIKLWTKLDYLSYQKLKDFEKKGIEIVQISLETQRLFRELSWKIADKYAAKDATFAKWWESMKTYMTTVGTYRVLSTPKYNE